MSENEVTRPQSRGRNITALLIAASLTGCDTPAPSFTCTDAIGCVDVAPGAPIKLAALLTLSGFDELQGTDQLRAIELAIDDRDGELLEHPIALQAEDTECTAGGATIVALKVTADPELVGILGTNCSVAAIPTSRIMSEAGLSMISGSNTLPSLTSVGGKQGSDWQLGYFRTVSNDVDQGRAAAVFTFEELRARRAAVVNDGDPYTRALTEVFAQVFTELGGEVVVSTGVNKGDTNMEPMLTAVATARSEMLFTPTFHGEATHIVVQADDFIGLEHTALMTTFKQQSFLEAVGTAGVGLYLVGPKTPKGDAYDGLVARYESKYGELPPGNYHAQAYDAANLMLSAIGAVAIQEEDGTLHIGRQALRDALYATRDFQGLTGRLGCDEFGDCGADRFDIVQVENPAAGLEGLTKNVIYSHGRERP